MTSKHTSGPWIKNGNRIENEDGALIAGVFDGTFSYDEDREKLRANGNLITAAPDLLEALRDVMTHVENGFIPDGESMYHARDAIAKATGASA